MWAENLVSTELLYWSGLAHGGRGQRWPAHVCVTFGVHLQVGDDRQALVPCERKRPGASVLLRNLLLRL